MRLRCYAPALEIHLPFWVIRASTKNIGFCPLKTCLGLCKSLLENLSWAVTIKKIIKPQHEVVIPYDYYMARYPVTIAQYRAFVEQSGYQTNDNNSLDRTSNHPVVNLTWYNALEIAPG